MEIRQINKELQKNQVNTKTISLRGINPVIPMDYPDPDVIRVEDTYYMATTTMHFFPGCQILKSKDLITWEHAAFVFDRLDSTPGQRLADGKGIYGKGMWAPSLRYHEGTYYLMFAANDTKTTYLYRASSVDGPWEKSVISGFYHDGSLLFDGGKVYVAYGNREIRLTELTADLSGPKEGGLDRILIKESDDNHFLGYEGSHLQKIRGKYYLFNIHSLPDRWMRTQSCFSSSSLTGEFTGGDILCDDLGYFGQGIAQGGIVDTPDGKWYGIFFQDRGGAGRMPVILPVTWKGDQPVIGEGGIAPAEIEIGATAPMPGSAEGYGSLFGSDDFQTDVLASFWQWNHEPEENFVKYGEKAGGLILQTDRVCKRLDLSVNTLTQRLVLPRCSGSVTLCGKDLKPGDRAGLGILCEEYTYLALEKTESGYDLIYVAVGNCQNPKTGEKEEPIEPVADSGKVLHRIELDPEKGEQVILRVETSSFAPVGNVTYGWKYAEEREFHPLPFSAQLRFTLKHFVGGRFALFCYSAKNPGGSAVFREFVYDM